MFFATIYLGFAVASFVFRVRTLLWSASINQLIDVVFLHVENLSLERV